MTEQELRQKVVDAALTWVGTKYHHMGRVKGVGVDCATLLCEVYEEAGIIQHIDLEYYPEDWHLHRDAERYMDVLLQYCDKTEKPQMGDIAMFKYGRSASHGSIIVAWPDEVIHSYIGLGCVRQNPQAMMDRLVGFYTFKEWNK